MPGFAMILGGAMSGWSDAKLDEIKSEREERMKELEAQRQDKRLAEDRDFRSKEAEIGRNFEAGQADKTRAYGSEENQKQREFQSTEAGKTRDASGDLITDDQGNSYSRTGSSAKPLLDDKGKPIKAVSGKASDKPAEVSTAEWLIQQNVAANPAEAWKMVRSARNDPDKSRASIYKAWLDALTKGALGQPDPVELEKQAREATEKTLTYLNTEDDSGGGAGQAGGAEGPGDVIPSDPAKRVVGKVYKAPNGKIAKWTGQGWELIQ
ncbi:hypothetical protein NL532_23980 [Mesorhizobium sp. C120A]|uniref:hypothetical protein n=1 Tax=unclassified Mesorhizobium TaxID=325217 RepID=UPI0003CFD7F2|nr:MULTISPECIES: hypothetical protein [unclassified Mesorhizobium]ESZ60635.1 hypothetical protein X728_14935 [Mesorhizobium sp. L103C120A0]WJI43668.1 hypothetical protein NL532_23980 [Mesorhizobium sp. C120A]